MWLLVAMLAMAGCYVAHLVGDKPCVSSRYTPKRIWMNHSITGCVLLLLLWNCVKTLLTRWYGVCLTDFHLKIYTRNENILITLLEYIFVYLLFAHVRKSYAYMHLLCINAKGAYSHTQHDSDAILQRTVWNHYATQSSGCRVCVCVCDVLCNRYVGYVCVCVCSSWYHGSAT